MVELFKANQVKQANPRTPHPHLNSQQFAKYSAIEFPDSTEPYEPRPAHLERHAPGEYQPTLPGMESMLKGEVTHTDVFFKHPSAWPTDGPELGIPGSDWEGHLKSPGTEAEIATKDLHPSQDWVNDNHLHEAVDPRTMRKQGSTPLVENIAGRHVIQDGHHRAVREIMGGADKIRVKRWDTP